MEVEEKKKYKQEHYVPKEDEHEELHHKVELDEYEEDN